MDDEQIRQLFGPVERADVDVNALLASQVAAYYKALIEHGMDYEQATEMVMVVNRLWWHKLLWPEAGPLEGFS